MTVMGCMVGIRGETAKRLTENLEIVEISDRNAMIARLAS
jgi:hypothetical protein